MEITDKERLDWLGDDSPRAKWDVRLENITDNYWEGSRALTVRYAIDAAIRAEAEEK